MADAERLRLSEAASGRVPWKKWGPYLSERAWGTVREDYSEDGNAWAYFPHDHARSRAYRWSEDGLGGICDDNQNLCFALTFWNGADPILKERIFGLTNPQGNHGEDAKEYWWYVDSTPTHSWMRWRYVYPQAAFPYDALVNENARRSRTEPEFELVDTGVFDDDRYWDITVDYAKAGPEDICIVVGVRNAGPEKAAIDVLPTLWFRNVWSWGWVDWRPSLRAGEGERDEGSAHGAVVITEHPWLGRRFLLAEGQPDSLFCENESNHERLWGVPNPAPFPKDGIGDHVIHGKPTVNPERQGTKAALRYQLVVGARDTVKLRLRLTDRDGDLQEGFDDAMAARRAEADEFYGSLTPQGATADEALVMRQAYAGMLWGKQFYHYDVARWADGDPAQPRPPEKRRYVRNSNWRHLDNFDVISMPDKWEYPWYAAWDLAFHCVPLAHVDPDFAKQQMLLMLRDWYEHPNGQIPAYEWNFGDVNPPVHAWATLKIFEIDGSRDKEFLARSFHKLLFNFTWWVNKKDRDGNNVFEGGFLGLDNIGPIDRSAPLHGVHLEQSDGTAWMAMFSLNLMRMALILARDNPVYDDLAGKFFEHFCYIASGINSRGMTHGLWDERDGFYYDILHRETGLTLPLRVRSMVGLIVLYATEVLDHEDLQHLPKLTDKQLWFVRDSVEHLKAIPHVEVVGDEDRRLLSIVGPDRLRRILETMLDESEFLSAYGIRALSRHHLDHPFEFDLNGAAARVQYEPAESSSGMFGGNSNWRGPIWFPVNYLLIESLRRFHGYLGDEFTVEHPRGSGRQQTLEEVADDLARRLSSIFLKDTAGRRPVFGGAAPFQEAWSDLVLFYEYFNGDDGAGVGASHQTGWTGLVADLVTTGRAVAAGQAELSTGARRAGSPAR